jgi:beta-galactosidase
MKSEKFLNSRLTTIWHGGDYNPEQWNSTTWDEDMELMKEAQFRVLTLGVFSWASLEPKEGEFHFEWLDQVIERLSDADRYFILATPSAAPPAWMARKYPEILRTGQDRVRRLHGNRVNYSLGSPIYRSKCREMAHRLAVRYGNHPRLLAWHLSNEYGGYGVGDFSEQSIGEFRGWLKKKYGSLEALNLAYWAAFWGHTFSDWDEIDAPGAPYGETSILGLTVDWQRFVTDQTVDFMLNECAPLREISPETPVTTNFMGTYPGLNYRKLAPHLDFVCWDSYPAFQHSLEVSDSWISAAFKHDLTRCLDKNRRWMLMECSPSSSNWYKTMSLKKPGMHRLEALQPIAHGADGVQYFQWRQSRGCQEQLHGAVVNHGTKANGRVFREVRQVGEDLAAMPDVGGTRFEAEVAIVFDWESMWALEAACGPVQGEKGYEATCTEHYRAFWEAGIPVDVIGQQDDLSAYKIVVAPMAYSLQPDFAENVAAFVASGGTFVTTYLSGWTDENSLIFEGGLLGPLRAVLGIWSEELDAREVGFQNWVKIDGLGNTAKYPAGRFFELIHTTTAETLGVYGKDFYADRPAVTVNEFGAGKAYYVGSRIAPDFTEWLLKLLATDAGIDPVVAELPRGVTAQRRRSATKEWLFLMNTTSEEQTITLPYEESEVLPPWGVSVHCRVLAVRDPSRK